MTQTLEVPLNSMLAYHGLVVASQSRIVLSSSRRPGMALGVERDSRHAIFVVPESQRLLADLRVPDLDQVVTTGRNDPTAIRGERHAVDRPGVACQGCEGTSGRDLPDPNRLVLARGGYPAAVRAERNTMDKVHVPGQAARAATVAGSQSRTDLSCPAEARSRPSGLNATP